MASLLPDSLTSPEDHAFRLINSILARNAHIAVIGLGYVGLPLAQAFWQAEFAVTGFDTDPAKLKKLNAGESYLTNISDSVVRQMVESGRFHGVDDPTQLGRADVILICVPTPLTRDRKPDLSFVEGSARQVASRLRPGQLVVLESTTYPGTTNKVVRTILEQSGLKSGEDFFLAYSPEREDPGNEEYSTARIPKIVGGEGDKALGIAELLYGAAIDVVVPVSSTRTAEAVKLTENIFRAVNIALVNELKQIYAKMEIDIWEVIAAAKTKPFGFMPFYPGPGLGGHCIPIDPFYLSWCAESLGLPARFIELAGEINTNMPREVVRHLLDGIAARGDTAPEDAAVLVLGVAYKKNVGDTRESPGLKIIEILEMRGVTVDYYDSWVPEIPKTRDHPALAGKRSIELTAAAVKAYDAVLICTDHDDLDYARIGRHARLVVDTRNAMARAGANLSNVIKA